ncbi:MAG: LPS assembly protein LptD [Gammaproteobacteria bacterium]|nr:LPS assembly protein LptD [Gammaproteobacteria bacterium]
MHLRALIFICLCVYCGNLFAEDSQWRQCGRQPSQHKTTANPSSPDFVSDESRRVHLFRIDQDVHADRVQYSEKEKKAVATGNVLLRDPDLDITSERVDYWTEDETAKAENVRYWYHPSHGSGTADKAERVSQDVIKLENATYSSCDFEDRDWELKAGKATLDRQKGVGTAKNVTAKFKGVPFFYTPWMSFPLNNERKTGFLAPVFGRSSNSGIDIETPFYWNIAPHRDALFTPRYLSKRGVQLSGNGRYLNDNNYGELNVQFLDDRDFDDERYLVSFEHQHFFNNHFRADLLYNNASDDDYFEDLGDSIGVTSTQRLERRGDLWYSANHFGGNWNGLVRLQQYQIVDDESLPIDDPYKRLPQILLTNSFGDLPAGIEFSSSNEWVAFDHDDRVDGNRLHLSTEISRPWTTPGFFFKPSMRLMHTSYDLSSSDGNNDPTRTLPSFSLDGGLIFERDITNSHRRQTLEPRLYYLYTPERNQSDIPLFDTGEYEFSFAQLFRNDRFTGRDRVADANQLTAAITSRYLNQNTGEELLRASLGQIFFFEDREVTLNNTEDDDDSYSNLAGELKIDFHDRWEAIAAALWDPQEEEFNRTNTRIQYRSANNFIFNIGHRFRRDDFSQSDISFIYPISEQWRAVGRWNYDFKDNRDLDLLGGLEYDTCCWKLSFAARRFTNDSEGDYNNSIEIQLTLKGLTSLGSPLTEQLQRNIRGYEDRNTFKY